MLGETYRENLETPVKYRCDVLVCGGGTAGAVAALAAAKTGADTMLVEKENFLGGSLVNHAGPLHSFFNLFYAFPETGKIQVVRGIPEEIVKRLQKEHGSYGHLEQRIGGDHDSTATIIDREIYKNTINQMCLENGVHLLLDTLIVGTIVEQGAVQGVIIENKSGRQVISAKVVIDCSGDADVAFRAGASCINMSRMQAVSMPFALGNVDLRKVEEFAEQKGIVFTKIHARKNEKEDLVRFGFNACTLPEFAEFNEGIIARPKEVGSGEKVPEKARVRLRMFGPWGVNYHENEWSYVNSNMMISVDPTDAEQLTNAEITLRNKCVEFTERLRRYVPGFEKCYISWTPSYLGIRASRIVECEYDLTSEDIESGQRFDDEVALYGYHDYSPSVKIRDGLYFGFPYRAFLPRKIENLLVAGRIITTEHSAHMSTRNTVSCMVQGHAVGTAAALSALGNISPRELDISCLREKLLEQNVFLG